MSKLNWRCNFHKNWRTTYYKRHSWHAVTFRICRVVLPIIYEGVMSWALHIHKMLITFRQQMMITMVDMMKCHLVTHHLLILILQIHVDKQIVEIYKFDCPSTKVCGWHKMRFVHSSMRHWQSKVWAMKLATSITEGKMRMRMMMMMMKHICNNNNKTKTIVKQILDAALAVMKRVQVKNMIVMMKAWQRVKRIRK